MGSSLIPLREALACGVLLSVLAGCSVLFEETESRSGRGADSDFCNSLAPLRDTFETDVTSSKWSLSKNTETSFSQAGDGKVVFDYPLASSGGMNGSLKSRFDHDLRGNELSVVVEEVSPLGETFIRLETDVSGVRAVIRYSNGMLVARLNENMVQLGTPYDPEIHQRWQIREEEGTLFFEAGPIGGRMTSIAQTDALVLFDPAEVRAEIGVINNKVSQEGHAVFGGVNLGADETSYCLAETFEDDFDDLVLGDIWKSIAEPTVCDAGLEDGSLVIASIGDPKECKVHTGSAVSLNESTIELRFLPAVVLTNQEVALRLSRDSNFLEIRADDTSVWAVFGLAGAPLEQSKKPVSELAILRMRNIGTEVIWEAETAGGQLLPIESQPVSMLFDLNGLSATIFAKSSDASVVISGINAD